MSRAFSGLSAGAALAALAAAGMAAPGPEMRPVEEAPQPSKTKRSRHTAAPLRREMHDLRFALDRLDAAIEDEFA